MIAHCDSERDYQTLAPEMTSRLLRLGASRDEDDVVVIVDITVDPMS